MGALVGAAVGAAVGFPVGFAVGLAVGLAVGFAVGLAVGITVAVVPGGHVHVEPPPGPSCLRICPAGQFAGGAAVGFGVGAVGCTGGE